MQVAVIKESFKMVYKHTFTVATTKVQISAWICIHERIKEKEKAKIAPK